jgi:hypothetical protein
MSDDQEQLRDILKEDIISIALPAATRALERLEGVGLDEDSDIHSHLTGAFHALRMVEYFFNQKRIDKSHCTGCYNDEYNYGLGGASECWSFKDAVLIQRRKVHINERPPHTNAFEEYPSCYRVPRYVFFDKEIDTE